MGHIKIKENVIMVKQKYSLIEIAPKVDQMLELSEMMFYITTKNVFKRFLINDKQHVWTGQEIQQICGNFNMNQMEMLVMKIYQK